MSDYEVNRIDYLSSRQKVVPDLYPVPLPPQSPSALNPQDRRSMRFSMYVHIRGSLQHWIASRAGGFRHYIVVVSEMYLTDTPEVVPSETLILINHSRHVGTAISPNDYHELFLFFRAVPLQDVASHNKTYLHQSLSTFDRQRTRGSAADSGCADCR